MLKSSKNFTTRTLYLYTPVQKRTTPYTKKLRNMKNHKVVAISYADARELKEVYRLGADKVDHVPMEIWKGVDIEVPADLEITSKIEDKVAVFTAKLVFRERCRHDYPPMSAYRVRLADGTDLLLGSSERPYPVVTESQNLSSGNSDSQLRELTVAYSDRKRIPVVSRYVVTVNSSEKTDS